MSSMYGLENRFRYHPPRTEEIKKDHERVRSIFFSVASEMDLGLPDCREKAVVMTKIEEAMFWANAAIARNQD